MVSERPLRIFRKRCLIRAKKRDGRQWQDDDTAAGTREKHLRGAEDPGVPVQLVVCEALEVFTVRGCGAEEEVPSNDVVDFAGIRRAEGPVEREVQEFAFLVTNEGHGLLEGVDCLDGTSDSTLHGVEGIFNGNFLRYLTRGDKQDRHNYFLHKMR